MLKYHRIYLIAFSIIFVEVFQWKFLGQDMNTLHDYRLNSNTVFHYRFSGCAGYRYLLSDGISHKAKYPRPW